MSLGPTGCAPQGSNQQREGNLGVEPSRRPVAIGPSPRPRTRNAPCGCPRLASKLYGSTGSGSSRTRRSLAGLGRSPTRVPVAPGTPMEPDNLRRSWGTIRAQAGLGRTRLPETHMRDTPVSTWACRRLPLFRGSITPETMISRSLASSAHTHYRWSAASCSHRCLVVRRAERDLSEEAEGVILKERPHEHPPYRPSRSSRNSAYGDLR
jgi:hypothetical protein